MYNKITDLNEIELRLTSFSSIDTKEVDLWLFIDQMQIYEESPYDKINKEYISDFWDIYGESFCKKETSIHKIWTQLISHFSEKDLLMLINYARVFYLWLYWKHEGRMIYKDFLESHFFNKIDLIKGNKKIISFLEKELRNILKNCPKNHERKVWFLIDALYWYLWSSKLNNEWEIDRYEYWRKFKEKWIVKLKR